MASRCPRSAATAIRTSMPTARSTSFSGPRSRRKRKLDRDGAGQRLVPDLPLLRPEGALLRQDLEARGHRGRRGIGRSVMNRRHTRFLPEASFALRRKNNSSRIYLHASKGPTQQVAPYHRHGGEDEARSRGSAPGWMGWTPNSGNTAICTRYRDPLTDGDVGDRLDQRHQPGLAHTASLSPSRSSKFVTVGA